MKIPAAEINLPARCLAIPVAVEFLVLLGRPSLVCLNNASHGQARKESRIDSILDSIINMAASSDSSSTCDSVYNSIVLTGLANLASNSLCLAMLGQSCSSCEVPKTIDALELLIAMGRGFEMVDERLPVLDALAICCQETSR